MSARRECIPGSGLPAIPYLAILAISIALFLVYNGLLWRAPREASHVARFAVSYLAVLPLSAGVLLGLRRFEWSRLVTATGSIWAIKLIVTAILYQSFARGTASQLEPAAPRVTISVARPLPAEPRASSAGLTGSVRGTVREGGRGLAGAVVVLDAPASEPSASPPARVEMVISGSRYERSLYLARSWDEIGVTNHDGVLHTAHVSSRGTPISNLPLPPSAASHALALPEPGIQHVHCDNHPGEETWVVVVDHPEATLTAADGSFALDHVPAGEARVAVVAVTEHGARRVETTASVRPSGAVTIDVDMERATALAP